MSAAQRKGETRSSEQSLRCQLKAPLPSSRFSPSLTPSPSPPLVGYWQVCMQRKCRKVAEADRHSLQGRQELSPV